MVGDAFNAVVLIGFVYIVSFSSWLLMKSLQGKVISTRLSKIASACAQLLLYGVPIVAVFQLRMSPLPGILVSANLVVVRSPLWLVSMQATA